jgi:predicted DNA-binding protein (MmcQ/YjbR family)
MNKTHWNTVLLDESVPSEEIEGMIDNSYDLVIKNLKKSDQLALKLRHK